MLTEIYWDHLLVLAQKNGPTGEQSSQNGFKLNAASLPFISHRHVIQECSTYFHWEIADVLTEFGQNIQEIHFKFHTE